MRPRKLKSNKFVTPAYDGIKPKCRNCNGHASNIIESRANAGMVMRRRSCEECGNVWKTLEINRDTYARVVKRMRNAEELVVALTRELEEARARLERGTIVPLALAQDGGSESRGEDVANEPRRAAQ